jgi:hypothetical protein
MQNKCKICSTLISASGGVQLDREFLENIQERVKFQVIHCLFTFFKFFS